MYKVFLSKNFYQTNYYHTKNIYEYTILACFYSKIKVDIKNGNFNISGCEVEFILSTNSTVEYELSDLQAIELGMSSSPLLPTDTPTTDIRYCASAKMTLGDGSDIKPQITYNDNFSDKFVLIYEPGEEITMLGHAPIFYPISGDIKNIANPTNPVTYTVKLLLGLEEFTVPFSGKTFINVTIPQV